MTPSPSNIHRSERRRQAKRGLQAAKASVQAKSLIECAEEALAPELTSFILLFWERGDPSTNTATIHLRNLCTRETLNLLLPAFEHAVNLDRQAKADKATPEYHAIMAAFVDDVKDSYARADKALSELDASRAKDKR